MRRFLATLGGMSPAVDTVLSNPEVRPGGMLQGEVLIDGGDLDAEVEFLSVGLVGIVDGEYEDEEETVEFVSTDLSDGFHLRAGERLTLPFSVQVPWETPLTHVFGEGLDGMGLGLSTELGMRGERDTGDLDEIAVLALPAQEAIFDALESLGFGFAGAELEIGELKVQGVRQTLPCFQEIEFVPPGRYESRLAELDLCFVAGPSSMEVMLMIGKRGSLLSSGGEHTDVFTVDYRSLDEVDWPARLEEWIGQAARGRF